MLIQPLALAFAEASSGPLRRYRHGLGRVSPGWTRLAGAAAPSRRRLLVLCPRVSRPAHGFELLALTPFTAETGATRVSPGSHLWPRDRAVQDPIPSPWP